MLGTKSRLKIYMVYQINKIKRILVESNFIPQ